MMDILDGLTDFLKKHEKKRGSRLMYDIRGYHVYLNIDEATNHYFSNHKKE